MTAKPQSFLQIAVSDYGLNFFFQLLLFEYKKKKKKKKKKTDYKLMLILRVLDLDIISTR